MLVAALILCGGPLGPAAVAAGFAGGFLAVAMPLDQIAFALAAHLLP